MSKKPAECKFIVDRETFTETLSLAARVAKHTSPKPALTCVLIEAEAGGITVKATDTEIGLSCAIDQVEVTSPGSILLPASELLGIVKGCTSSTITITADGSAASIVDDNGKFNLFEHPIANFPPIEFETEDAHAYTMPEAELNHQIAATLPASARENSRYAIHGVLFHHKGTALKLVATDGHRLSLSQSKVKTRPEIRRIVPAEACRLLMSAMNDPEAVVGVSWSEWRGFFDIGRIKISTALIEGNFPPYEDVIPKGADRHAEVDVASFTAAMYRARVLTSDESKGVRMSFTHEGLELTSRAPERGDASIKLSLDSLEGNAIEIGVNPDYLIPAVKSSAVPTVKFSMQGTNKPMVITAGSDKHVVMPLNLQ